MAKNQTIGEYQTPLFKTQFTRHLFRRTYEINTMPSMTIPDQALTVSELMKRQQNGAPLIGERVPMYENDDHIWPSNWDKMDLAERMDFIDHAKDEISNIRKKFEDSRKQEELVRYMKEQGIRAVPIDQDPPNPGTGAAPSAGADPAQPV